MAVADYEMTAISGAHGDMSLVAFINVMLGGVPVKNIAQREQNL